MTTIIPHQTLINNFSVVSRIDNLTVVVSEASDSELDKVIEKLNLLHHIHKLAIIRTTARANLDILFTLDKLEINQSDLAIDSISAIDVDVIDSKLRQAGNQPALISGTYFHIEDSEIENCELEYQFLNIENTTLTDTDIRFDVKAKELTINNSVLQVSNTDSVSIQANKLLVDSSIFQGYFDIESKSATFINSRFEDDESGIRTNKLVNVNSDLSRLERE